MVNPVRKAREAKGLTINDFALVLEAPYNVVSAVETGLRTRLPRKWKEGFERLGLDYETMQKAYTEWRNRQAEAVLEGIQNGDRASEG